MWRVARDVCLLGAVLALAGAWLGGPGSAHGIATGVALALGNFGVLVARVCATNGTAGPARALW